MRNRKFAALLLGLALVAAACGGGSSGDTTTTADGAVGGSGDPLAGAAVYQGTCSSCHGTDLKGIEGLGKQLAPSDFVAAKTEAELVAFIKVGRPAGDPENSTGVDMPPKGGNPALDDQDLADVAAYLLAQQ